MHSYVDLAEKNKKLAAIQYIKLLGLKNPEKVVHEGNGIYVHINNKGRIRRMVVCISHTEYVKKEKEYSVKYKTRFKKCLGYYVLELL